MTPKMEQEQKNSDFLIYSDRMDFGETFLSNTDFPPMNSYSIDNDYSYLNDHNDAC